MDQVTDTVNSYLGGASKDLQAQQPGGGPQDNSGSTSTFGSLGDKVSSVVGGSQGTQKDEGMLGKGVDYVQQTFVGPGGQSSDSGSGQQASGNGGASAGDIPEEHVNDFIRDKYKSTADADVAPKDK